MTQDTAHPDSERQNPFSKSADHSSADPSWFIIHRPIMLIPVLPNRKPDADCRLHGMVTEMGADGATCVIDSENTSNARQWVLGLEDEDFSTFFVSAVAEKWRRVKVGSEVRLRFCEVPGDPLSVGSLIPSLDPTTRRFETRLDAEVIQAWVELGVVRPVLLHRVYVCPECQAVPIFGNGCSNCGSIRLVPSQLIHHFSCAHVGYVDEFLKGSEIVCPKCHVRGLVVGADFENLNGPYTCLECSYTSTELEHIGSCLSCGTRFPLGLAALEEITGYDVYRLDPLDFLGST